MIRSDRAVTKCLAEGKQDSIYCRPWSKGEEGGYESKDSSAFPQWWLGAVCRSASSLFSSSSSWATPPQELLCSVSWGYLTASEPGERC